MTENHLFRGTPEAFAMASFQLSQRLVRHLVLAKALPLEEAATLIEEAATDAESTGNPVGFSAGALIRRLLEISPLDGTEPP